MIPTRRLVCLTATALTLATAGGCASIVVHEKPIAARETHELIEAEALVPAGNRRAHALIRTGLELDRKHPAWAVTYFRDAALEALPMVIGGGANEDLPPEVLDARAAYRRAIEYMLATADRRVKSEGISWKETMEQSGVAIGGRVGIYDAALWQEVLPAQQFEVKGFHRTVARGGVGAPVVIRMARSVEDRGKVVEGGVDVTDPSERHFPAQLFRSSSAVIRPGGAGEPQAVLVLQDPTRNPDMMWSPNGGPALPLAYDMTIGVARQFHEGNLDIVGRLGVLYPSEYDGRTGILICCSSVRPRLMSCG